MHEKPAPPSAAPAGTGPPVDRREVPRFHFPTHAPLLIVVPPSREPSIVGVKDVSTKGAGLTCAEPIALGALLTLRWTHGPWKRWRILGAQVVRLASDRAGGWVVGCVFTDRLRAEDLEAWLRYDQEQAGLDD
jgi:hypothetical protein